MAHPTTSDAMQSGYGLKMKGVIDPRTDWEKMRVWEARRICIEMGYPQAKDWTKNECGQVFQGEALRKDVRKMKLSGEAIASTPDNMDMLSVLAGLRGIGWRPTANMTDQEIRDLYKAKLEELKTPKEAGPVTPRAAFVPAPRVDPEGGYSLVPIDKWPRSRLLKKAKEMGLMTNPSMKQTEVLALIQGAERGADSSANGQPRTA